MMTMLPMNGHVQTVSMGRSIAHWSQERGDEIAVRCLHPAGGIDELSWRDFDRHTNQLARLYLALGATAGDMVVIALPSGVGFLAATFAVFKIGAVPVPVSFRLPKIELQELVELSGSRFVVGFDDGELPGVKSIPTYFDVPESVNGGQLPDVVGPAWKSSTSGGSTGRPKIVVSSDPAVVDLGGPTVLNTPEGGTVVMGGPLYHNAPYHVAVQGLVRGLPIVVFERFDPELLLLAIDRYKARSALVVPTHMSRAMKLPANIRSKYDLSSINQLWHSAAPCSIDVKEAWLEWVGAEKVYEQYSSSEALAATLIRGDEWLEHRGSVGRVCRGEMKIVDPETGIDLDCGQIGEIYMRLSPDGNTGFRYIGADLKTNHEGWASVGDLGHFDEDGYLYFADRRLDMIISGGANIYPAEVENALLRHPSVVSCAVIGLPDDDLGQKVHAIVQTDNPDVREGDLTEFLLTQIVRYKIPRSLEIVDWSVRDDAGKVRRSALREERVGK